MGKNQIRLTRVYDTDNATFGVLQLLPDLKPLCFTLEDEYRAQKVAGETRIPAGTYEITLRNVGGFHTRYAKLFGDMHKGMLWLRNVPGFEYILIHCGNTDKDSAGCILVGNHINSSTMALSQSQDAYKRIYPNLVKAVQNGGLRIEIRDHVL